MTDKAAGACLLCPGATLAGRSKAARSVGRCGAMNAPPGSSSPVSSKITTPLQSRLQPCSGWLTMVRAASRAGAEGAGQGGVCGHTSVPRRSTSSWTPYGGPHYVIGSGSWPCAGSCRRAGRLGCWASPLPGLRQLLTRQAPAAEVPVQTRGPSPARHASVNGLVLRLRTRTGRSRRRRGSARCT
jgi:hypothetical protein